MQESQSYSKSQLHFSRWSRKSYAIFTSLGRDVKISRLSVDMCGKSLLKLSKISMFFYEKFDYLFSAINLSSLKKIEIPDMFTEMLLLLNIKDYRVLPLVALDNSINKNIEDNS